MTDFILKTKTERALYVEAMLYCLDIGSITPAQVCSDIRDIVGTADHCDEATTRSVLHRIEGIVSAYRMGSIDQTTATNNLVELLHSVSPETVDDLVR